MSTSLPNRYHAMTSTHCHEIGINIHRGKRTVKVSRAGEEVGYVKRLRRKHNCSLIYSPRRELEIRFDPTKRGRASCTW